MYHIDQGGICMKNVLSSQQGEAHNQYRNRLGSISGHQHLMSQKSDDSGRREEIKRFPESSETIEKNVHREIEEIGQNTPSFRDRQIAYDTARGAYLNQPEGDRSQMTDSRTHDVRDAMEVSA
jgi:hypothetical protein